MENIDFFCTNNAGRIVRKGFAPKNMIDLQVIHDDEFFHIGCCHSATHYIDGSFLTQPAQPSSSHEWSDDLFSWVLNMDMAKSSAKRMITEARNAEEKAGFMAYGKLIDSDSLSVARITTSVQAAQAIGSTFSINWTCADNSVITLDHDQMIAMPALMSDVANAIHEKARSLKAQIDAATTPEEINAIQW